MSISQAPGMVGGGLSVLDRSVVRGVEEALAGVGGPTAAEVAAAAALAAEQTAWLNALMADEPGAGAWGAGAWAGPASSWSDEFMGVGVGVEADVGWRMPVEDLREGLRAAAAGLERAALSPGEAVLVPDAAVVDALAQAGRARVAAVSALVALAIQVKDRGLHQRFGLVDWLRSRCSWLSVTEAGHVRTVVEAAATHWGGPLVEAVLDGRTGVHRAAQVARCLTRLGRVLDVDQQEAYGQIAIDAACNPDLSDAELSQVCKRLIIDLIDTPPDPDPDDQSGHVEGCDGGAGCVCGSGSRRRPDPVRALRSVTRQPLGNRMTRFTIDAPEDDAAMLDGVLNGPLAAPTPGVGDDGEPVPDPRSADMRRYDAFMTVFSRGLANPGAPPSSARASVIITVAADPSTGRPQGAAWSTTGQSFTARAAGRYACLGDLTPVVLGEHGEPLRLGRTVRLATPGQFKALLVRDRHCTFPGCTIPGSWCDAHHIVWWSRGGGTDIELLVLLCDSHHHQVHDEDLIATVEGGVVTWHT